MISMTTPPPPTIIIIEKAELLNVAEGGTCSYH
jgi:hypothetical protein